VLVSTILRGRTHFRLWGLSGFAFRGWSIDIGSTTRIDGEPHAPVGRVTQFFYRAASRGEQFRSDYQKLYDEGIQIALKYLGE
jgi:hypothetical protein